MLLNLSHTAPEAPVPDSAFAADVRTCVARLFDSVNPENRRARQPQLRGRAGRVAAGWRGNGNGARVVRFANSRYQWPQAERSPHPHLSGFRFPNLASAGTLLLPAPQGEGRNSAWCTNMVSHEFRSAGARLGTSPLPSSYATAAASEDSIFARPPKPWRRRIEGEGCRAGLRHLLRCGSLPMLRSRRPCANSHAAFILSASLLAS